MPVIYKSSIFLDPNIKIIGNGTSGIGGFIWFEKATNTWVYSEDNGITQKTLNKTASDVAFNSTSGLASTNVQSALEELNDLIKSTEDLKFVSADVSTTQNTLQNIPDLVFSVKAFTKYRVSGTYRIGCNNTGGVKFGIDGPSGTTPFIFLYGAELSSTQFRQTGNTSLGTATSAALNAFSGSAGLVFITGTITIGETSGNIQFQFQSTTNGQTSTIYSEGTFLSLTPMT